jgi:hypothetical protein
LIFVFGSQLQPRIKSIRLTSHQIGDAGCVTLASAIADSGIISLDLSGNSIGEHGWAALGNTLQVPFSCGLHLSIAV